MTWRPIETYPILDGRDADNKWFPGPDGPIADFLLEDGEIVRRANWRGEPTKGGGTAYAFWTQDCRRGLGTAEPTHWRLSEPANMAEQ